MRLESLYQEVILDNYRHLASQSVCGAYDSEVHHGNRGGGGNEVTLRFPLNGLGPVIRLWPDVSYDALVLPPSAGQRVGS